MDLLILSPSGEQEMALLVLMFTPLMTNELEPGHVLIGPEYLHFCELPIHVFCPFLIGWSFSLFCFSFKGAFDERSFKTL